MAKKKKSQVLPSLCPQCKATLERLKKVLRSHFRESHGRLPTHGEEVQFLTFRNTGVPYTEKDFVKPRIEVSGGSCSSK
jgi:dipeptidase